MTETLVCPNCDSPILVPAHHLGAKIACPRCEKLTAVPGAPTAGPEDIMEGRPKGADKQLPLASLEPDEDAAPKRGSFKPCPRCGAEGAKRVLFTPWGSFYGPAMFHHVRCPECRHAYNGRSGGSNLIPAVLFVMIPAVLMAAIIAYLVILILPRL